MSADLVAFLHAQFRELENDIQTEIDTSAPLYRPGPELLAGVAAARAILDLHPTLTEESGDYTDGVPVPLLNPYYCACQVEDFIIEGHEPCRTKLILARPFASRAGFDPSWLD